LSARRLIRQGGGPVPDLWREIAEQRKTFIGWPEWSHVEPLKTGPKVQTSRADLHTAYGETTDAVVQLTDEGGVGIIGARLRLKAWAFRRNKDVTATLEALGGRSFVTIARVDAWPSDPHLNAKARKVPGLRHLESQVIGCHVHRFHDNAVLGSDAFGAGPDANLPVAQGIPNGIGSFREFLRTVGAEFNIFGLDEVQPPDGWTLIL
jgi:hypothetical protein